MARSKYPNQAKAEAKFRETGQIPEGLTYSPYKKPPFRWAGDESGSDAEYDDGSGQRVDGGGFASESAGGKGNTDVNPSGDQI